MTLLRTIAVLVGALALLLVVVTLRVETTRLNYAISKCQREAHQLRQELVEAELELARLRNPARIRQRTEQVVRELSEQSPQPGAGRRGERP